MRTWDSPPLCQSFLFSPTTLRASDPLRLISPWTLSTLCQATPRPLGWLPILMVESLLASEACFVSCSHPAQVLPSFHSILQHSVSHQQNLPCSFSNCCLNAFPFLASKKTWLSADETATLQSSSCSLFCLPGFYSTSPRSKHRSSLLFIAAFRQFFNPPSFLKILNFCHQIISPITPPWYCQNIQDSLHFLYPTYLLTPAINTLDLGTINN